MSSTRIEWRTDVENAPLDTELLVTVRFEATDGVDDRFVEEAQCGSPGNLLTPAGWHYYDDQGWWPLEGWGKQSNVVIAWAYPIAPYDGDVPKKEKP